MNKLLQAALGALVIWGMGDKALLPVQLELEPHVPNLTIERIEDAALPGRGAGS